MSNQRCPSIIPGTSQTFRITPRPLSPRPTQKKSTSCQTEAEIPVEVEEFDLDTTTLLGNDEDAIEQEYNKAISYINFFHEETNKDMEYKYQEKTGIFFLPTVLNYSPFFRLLIGTTENKKGSIKSSNKHVRTKRSCTPKKTSKQSPKPICVEDIEKTRRDYNENLTMLSSCIDVELLKQKLEKLSCLLDNSTDIDKKTQNRDLPSTSRELQDKETTRGSLLGMGKDDMWQVLKCIGIEESESKEAESEEWETEESETEEWDSEELESEKLESKESESEESTLDQLGPDYFGNDSINLD